GDSLSEPVAGLGWRNRPGAEARLRGIEYDVSVHINSRGLRGPECEYQRTGRARRVLLLGGSFAEGYTVSEDKTVRARLEERLRTSGCGPVEVINGGGARDGTEREGLRVGRGGGPYRRGRG